MTVDQIVSAIRALPVPERLRVIEMVAHDVANDVSGSAGATPAGAKLVERHGLLLVDAEGVLPADAFDHRLDREAQADRVWSGS